MRELTSWAIHPTLSYMQKTEFRPPLHSWGTVTILIVTLVFLSYAGLRLRENIVRFERDPPLKTSSLQFYLQRSSPDPQDQAIISKLVRDYGHMEATHLAMTKITATLVWTAALGSMAGACFGLASIHRRRANPKTHSSAKN